MPLRRRRDPARPCRILRTRQQCFTPMAVSSCVVVDRQPRGLGSSTSMLSAPPLLVIAQEQQILDPPKADINQHSPRNVQGTKACCHVPLSLPLLLSSRRHTRRGTLCLHTGGTRYRLLYFMAGEWRAGSRLERMRDAQVSSFPMGERIHGLEGPVCPLLP